MIAAVDGTRLQPPQLFVLQADRCVDHVLDLVLEWPLQHDLCILARVDD